LPRKVADQQVGFSIPQAPACWTRRWLYACHRDWPGGREEPYHSRTARHRHPDPVRSGLRCRPDRQGRGDVSGRWSSTIHMRFKDQMQAAVGHRRLQL